MGAIQTAIRLNDSMTPALRSINRALNIVLSSFESMQRACGNAVDVSSIQAARNELSHASVAIGQVEDGIRRATQNQDELDDSIRSGTSAATALESKITGLVATYATFQSVKKTLDISDTLASNTARLNLMNDGLQTTAGLENYIYAAAQKSRGSFLDMESSVAQLGNLAGNAFSSSKQIVDFTEQINKQLKISGASTMEASAAMLQLTQSLSKGVLNGDELTSIMENGSMIAKTIADHLGVSVGQMKEMAANGEVTSSVIISAIMDATEKTNAAFESLPKTWSDVWTDMKNTAIMEFQPVLDKLNAAANSDSFQKFSNGVLRALSVVSKVVLGILTLVGNIGRFMVSNWSIISPIIWGTVAALAIYTVALSINTIMQNINNISKIIAIVAAVAHGSAITDEMLATTGMTEAQLAFNAALYACPITWIIIAIIAVIAIIFIVIAVINKVTGKHISAMGVICGSVAVVAAVIKNIVLGLLNGLVQLVYTIFVEPFIGIIEWVLNAANGGFDSFGDAVKNLLGQIISWFLSLGKVVTKIIDAIFGTDWTSGLNSLQDKVLSWGKNNKAITIDRNAIVNEISPKADRTAYSDAYSSGYDFGKSIQSKLSSYFTSGMDNGTTVDTSSIEKALNSASTNLGNTAASTADTADAADSIKDSVSTSTEDLKYLRDAAERETINRFTTAEIRVDMTNHNNINSDMDLDGIISYLETSVYNSMSVAAEGV